MGTHRRNLWQRKSILKEKNIYESITGLNLQDVLIIRNWIDYAKGIGDTSVNSLNVEGLKNPFIYNNAISVVVNSSFLCLKGYNI